MKRIFKVAPEQYREIKRKPGLFNFVTQSMDTIQMSTAHFTFAANSLK